MRVLDASAVLALLQDEPGADAVEEAVDRGAVISSVNLAEVLVKLVDAGAAPDRAADLVLGLFVEVEPYDLQAAHDAAEIHALEPRAGLSLADRACLSLGRARGSSVLTTDQEWTRVGPTLDVDVHLVR